ncbi:ABC-2 type transport system ATP-binding protein [Caldalkalibacillus uzonensis]|uniref:ABC-2 type transport system ATP-binding protein n=1 Tax=Caldalkalibacillus uzonensis TaxID=353224 RepID=A0ABU0CXP3_9BACI|nr:ABC transporter ATP-binding protein [Caldalkalibacillus uzonensis]MDQ0340547.1 ABC-2 type transport system ATP-binding protein [Caldalkalibacillus uzonensis]
MHVIETEKLSKVYGSATAIDQLSLTIGENKLIGLIGRNGAGKTTLMKLIAGYLLPSAGQIKVFGEPPFNNLTVSSNMILTNDRLPVIPTLTIAEIMDSMALFYPHWDHGLAKRLCQYFELNSKVYPNTLSKGQQSTLYTIIGIAARCPLTMLDEPTTGMDKAVRKDIYRVLLKDYLNHPRTMIISSHLLNELEEILEEIILLDKGQKKVHLPVEELSRLVIRLRGKKDALAPVLETKLVIDQQPLGPDSLTVVVKNELPEDLLRSLRQQQVEILSVPTDETCVYLTKTRQGGIDDVFNHN